MLDIPHQDGKVGMNLALLTTQLLNVKQELSELKEKIGKVFIPLANLSEISELYINIKYLNNTINKLYPTSSWLELFVLKHTTLLFQTHVKRSLTLTNHEAQIKPRSIPKCRNN